MGGALKSTIGKVVSGVGMSFGGGSQPAGSVADPAATPAYQPPPELRGTQADANNAMDFQANAARRRVSGSGAQMLASAGTTGSNAGTKTLLGS